MRNSLFFAAALLVGAVVGCGSGLPPATNPDVARTAIVAALDAWKAGKPSESLKALSPPVDFLDLNWSKGAALESYEIKSQTQSALSVVFTVELKLKGSGSKPRRRNVTYTADAGQAVVIRPEM